MNAEIVFWAIVGLLALVVAIGIAVEAAVAGVGAIWYGAHAVRHPHVAMRRVRQGAAIEAASLTGRFLLVVLWIFASLALYFLIAVPLQSSMGDETWRRSNVGLPLFALCALVCGIASRAVSRWLRRVE